MSIPQIEAERKYRQQLNNHSLLDIIFMNVALFSGVVFLLGISSVF